MTDIAEDQHDADLEAWLTGLPEALRPTGRRHGRHLTSFVLACGVATHAFGLIHSIVHRNREIMQPLTMIQQTMDGLARAVMEDNGWTQAHFTEVQMDIERAGSLALVEPGKTKSGIILAH